MKKQHDRMAVMGGEINQPTPGGRMAGLLCRVLPVILVLTPFVAHPACGAATVYRIAPSEDLSRVAVEVRLPPGASAPLHATRGRLASVGSLERCDAGPVETRRNRIVPDPAGDCLRYSYPLTELAGRRSPEVAGGAIVSAPAEWLWTPEGGAGLPIRIEFALPATMSVSVPWKPVAPGVFELPASPGSATAAAVFGAFRTLDVPVADTRLRVAAVDGPKLRLDPDVVRAWLATAAADVAGVGGSFPSPDVQVIVQPVRSRGASPVPFGYVIRDGGEAVRFFVDPGRSLDELQEDWTATHEFSHLLLPYVTSAEKWVSEGFASYYQNVLLARRGVYSEQEAWDRFHRAFVSAARVRHPPPLDELHRRDFWDVRMLLYWSGAALALRADVALRTGGMPRTEAGPRTAVEPLGAGAPGSLDAVLRRLAACCLPSSRVWRAQELFQKLDEVAGSDVFMPLFDAHMREPGMPDLAPLYADLGIEPISDFRVRLNRSGRLASVREAIMTPKD